MEERYLQVAYHVLGAVVGWLAGVVMMIVATMYDMEDLRGWALLVVAASAVMSVHCMLTRGRARLLEAIDLQLSLHQQAASQANGVPRIPSGRP